MNDYSIQIGEYPLIVQWDINTEVHPVLISKLKDVIDYHEINVKGTLYYKITKKLISNHHLDSLKEMLYDEDSLLAAEIATMLSIEAIDLDREDSIRDFRIAARLAFPLILLCIDLLSQEEENSN